MADYVVLYNSSDLVVHRAWLKTTSDNISTWKTDGYLSVDGVKVVEGLDDLKASYTAAVVTNPTDMNVDERSAVFEVDQDPSPTDVTERAGGSSGKPDPIFTYV